MLVETKARVGVFAIALGAYLPQFPTLVPEFEGQYAAFKKTLPDTVDVIDGGIVTTKEQSMAAGDKFRTADVDLVILQLLTYATSYNMLPAVRDLDVPVVLVNVQKKKAPITPTPTPPPGWVSCTPAALSARWSLIWSAPVSATPSSPALSRAVTPPCRPKSTTGARPRRCAAASVIRTLRRSAARTPA